MHPEVPHAKLSQCMVNSQPLQDQYTANAANGQAIVGQHVLAGQSTFTPHTLQEEKKIVDTWYESTMPKLEKSIINDFFFMTNNIGFYFSFYNKEYLYHLL